METVKGSGGRSLNSLISPKSNQKKETQYEQALKTFSCSFGGYLIRGRSGLCNVNSPVLRRKPPFFQSNIVVCKKALIWGEVLFKHTCNSKRACWPPDAERLGIGWGRPGVLPSGYLRYPFESSWSLLECDQKMLCELDPAPFFKMPWVI